MNAPVYALSTFRNRRLVRFGGTGGQVTAQYKPLVEHPEPPKNPAKRALKAVCSYGGNFWGDASTMVDAAADYLVDRPADFVVLNHSVLIGNLRIFAGLLRDVARIALKD